MSFGGQTVTFVGWQLGARGALGVKAETPVEVDVPGCRFRTLNAKELTEAGFDAGLEIWKCTAPINATTTGIEATGYLKYGGEMFAVIGGPQIHPLLNGGTAPPAHVTIHAQKPS